ncbi:exonuclease mut-7 homolog [Pseudonaja textilis]|uniref:exonuclease mut-7 homolog n=1 Tax=Pseudonaja textilis TaxID=8673 RepID=UPI000EAABB43|nr:exonuclease mut-7 homolog [Pseudonaja textilis]
MVGQRGCCCCGSPGTFACHKAGRAEPAASPGRPLLGSGLQAEGPGLVPGRQPPRPPIPPPGRPRGGSAGPPTRRPPPPPPPPCLAGPLFPPSEGSARGSPSPGDRLGGARAERHFRPAWPGKKGGAAGTRRAPGDRSASWIGRKRRLEGSGEQDEGAAVFPPPEDTSVEDFPSHDSSEQDPLLQKLQALWVWKDMEKLREEMRLGFASLPDPLAWLLDVLDCCKDWGGPGLLVHIVRELQGWIKNHARDQPSGLKLEELQARLLTCLTRCHVSLLQPLVSLYQLHTADSHRLLGFVDQLCQQGKFKEAAILSIKLKLQPDLEFEKVCVPLLLQDRMELIEAYVEGSLELQQSLLQLLDSWSVPGFQIKDLARQYRALPGKWPEKINHRTMNKVAFRLLQKYSLDPVLYPHILNQRHLGTLKYLLHKRFVEKSMTQENWSDHIQGIIEDNQWLQEQLVQLLVRYAGLEVAVQWARHYRLLGDSLPPGLAARMDEPAIPERDDASQQGPSAWDSLQEGCYQLPVPRADVLFLSTWEEVMACQEQVLQVRTSFPPLA